MNWNHLYYFYEVARLGSLKAAAQMLGCGVSTISEQIKKLEISLETQLFKKVGRDLVLTESGCHIYDEAKFIFEKGKRLVESVKPNDLAGYNVKLSIENHLESQSLYKFLNNYWDIYSDFGLVETKRSKNLSQSIHFLENDIVDMALTSTPINDHNFFSFKILSMKYGLFIKKDFESQHMVANSLLSRLPFAFFGASGKDESAMRSLLLECGLQIKEEIRCEHPEFLISLCKQGKIILLLPLAGDSSIDGLEMIKLEREIEINVYALGRKVNESLLFTRKMAQLKEPYSNPSKFVSQFLSSNFRGIESQLNS